jgi:hypothetical protein
MTNTIQQVRETEIREANSDMAFGAGPGAMGTGTALLAGATCRRRFVIAPALSWFRVWKRITAHPGACRESANNSSNPVKSESAG